MKKLFLIICLILMCAACGHPLVQQSDQDTKDATAQILNAAVSYVASSKPGLIKGDCYISVTDSPLTQVPCRGLQFSLKDDTGKTLQQVQADPSGRFEFQVEKKIFYKIELDAPKYFVLSGKTAWLHDGDDLRLTLVKR